MRIEIDELLTKKGGPVIYIYRIQYRNFIGGIVKQITSPWMSKETFKDYKEDNNLEDLVKLMFNQFG